ncbi:uncharacterized protein PAC_09834 [Phialocephala subalpina]|uniref:Heterokaryon incompatibility domain-containing protein n=1 Tax=Phialocephala subalpina TaxID=576137 RepID=A0A1L7X4J7_9HELO|nr:uncharacterized protein PAC_09834 [Phialocephala subalpina]
MATKRMQNIYQSVALNPAVEEIRTVKVQSGSGNVIFCELERLVLPQPDPDAKGESSKPVKANYTALSYMWDYNTSIFPPLTPWRRRNQISFNGALLTVKPNLHAALHQLRHETEPRIFWIDAICINQADDNEKTSQVKLMRKIYALAEKTVVWLGQETYVSAQGFKSVRFLADIMRPSQPHQPRPSSQSFTGSNRDLWHVGAFTLLLRNPYFTRIWIVQEIGLSQNLEFRGGEESVSLSDLALAAAAAAFSALGSKNSLNFTNILAVRSLIRGRPQEGLEDPSWMHAKAAGERLTLVRDIFSIMSLFRGSQAGKKVDKIFGLLGLCREMENSQTFGIEEDYSLSVTDAYIRTAISILVGRRGFDLFAALRLQPDHWYAFKLPSWVPDWSDTQQFAVPINAGPGGHTEARQSEFDYRVENASSLLRSDLRTHILYLSGNLIDEITEIGQACNTEKAQASAWFCFKTMFNFAGSHRLETFVNWWTQFDGKGNESVSQEFLATVTCGRDSMHNTTTIMELIGRFQQSGFRDLNMFFKLAWALIPIRASELYFRPTLERLHIITLQCLSLPITLFLATYLCFAIWPRLVMFKLRQQEEDFYDNGLAHMEGRTVARTEKGRLALVPDGTRHGDLVAICKGGRVPLILRNASSKGRFQIVGEGYVHGAMDVGEGYDEDRCMKLAIV